MHMLHPLLVPNVYIHIRPLQALELTSLNVLAHHGNHQVEKTNGLDESETQNGVGEELSSHGWVTGNGHQQSSKDHSNTDTGTSETDGSGTHTQVLGDLDHGGGNLAVEATLLHDVAGGVGEDGRGLLTLEGVEGGGAGGDACYKMLVVVLCYTREAIMKLGRASTTPRELN